MPVLAAAPASTRCAVKFHALSWNSVASVRHTQPVGFSSTAFRDSGTQLRLASQFGRCCHLSRNRAPYRAWCDTAAGRPPGRAHGCFPCRTRARTGVLRAANVVVMHMRKVDAHLRAITLRCATLWRGPKARGCATLQRRHRCVPTGTVDVSVPLSRVVLFQMQRLRPARTFGRIAPCLWMAAAAITLRARI